MTEESRCTLKCLPHQKCAGGQIITDLICLPLITISPAPLKVSTYRPQKVFRGRQFTGKIRPARTVAGRGGFLPIICRSERDFSGGRSYTRTPARLLARPASNVCGSALIVAQLLFWDRRRSQSFFWCCHAAPGGSVGYGTDGLKNYCPWFNIYPRRSTTSPSLYTLALSVARSVRPSYISCSL